MNGTLCPKCKQNTLPRVPKGSSINAVRCQNPECDHIEVVVEKQSEAKGNGRPA